jgi:hypothetical protein
MSRQAERIKKVLNETLTSGIFGEENISARDVVELCEAERKLYSYKGMYISPIKTTFNGQESIRIIFTMKQSDSGRVQDVEKILQLIRDLESVLVYVDNTDQTKSEGFVYLDVIKILKEED